MNRWGSALVSFAGLTRPQQLVGGMRLEEVYTAAERVRSTGGASVQHWAGRLAGKRAVLRLLGLPPTAERLGQVEVLPRPTPSCRATSACRDGHPPAVRLAAPLAELVRPDRRVRVSISHTSERALAVAICSTRLPEDEET
ncbi:phosphopantetheinyl transferase [Nonomuraea sp. NPDC050691]|uniref:phosphopantetheinyl transferase n=1 Tax=Nonomuraea sp. NPDC050691 TaxID=3155661 RepID=UPI0034069940